MKQNLLLGILLAFAVTLPADFILERLRERVIPLPTIRKTSAPAKAPTFLVAEPLEIRGTPVSHVEPSAADVICEVDAANPEELDALDYSANP